MSSTTSSCEDDYISFLGFNNTYCPTFIFPLSKAAFQVCGYMIEENQSIVTKRVVLRNENGMKLEQDPGLFVQFETTGLQSLSTNKCLPLLLSLQSTCPSIYSFYGSNNAGSLGSVLLYNSSAATGEVALPVLNNYRYISVYVIAHTTTKSHIIEQQQQSKFHVKSGICNLYVQDIYIGAKPTLSLPASTTSPQFNSIYSSVNSNTNTASGSSPTTIVYIALAVMIPLIVLSACALFSWWRHRSTASVSRRKDLEAWIADTADNVKSPAMPEFSLTSPMKRMDPPSTSHSQTSLSSTGTGASAGSGTKASSLVTPSDSITIDRRSFRAKRVVNPSPLRVEVAAPPASSASWRLFFWRKSKAATPSPAARQGEAGEAAGSLKEQIDYIRNKYGLSTANSTTESSKKDSVLDMEGEVGPVEGGNGNFESSKSFVL